MNGIVMENLETFALRFTQGAAHFLWIGVLLASAVWVADRLVVCSAAARHGLHLVGMLLLALALPVCLVAVNVAGGPERKVLAQPPNVVVEPVAVAPAAPGIRLEEPRPMTVRGEAALPATRLPYGEAVAEESIGVSTASGWLERSAGRKVRFADVLASAFYLDLQRHGDLHTAARDGDAATFARLLERGADPNKRNWRNATPLDVAASRDEVAIGKMLMEHGADPALKCNGRPVRPRSEEFRKLLEPSTPPPDQPPAAPEPMTERKTKPASGAEKRQKNKPKRPPESKQ